MPFVPHEDVDNTPCPARNNSVRTSILDDDDDSIIDDDYTREIIPEVEQFRSLHKSRAIKTNARKGPALKEPPRRVTNYVPPQQTEKQPKRDSREHRLTAEEEKVCANVAAALEPKRQTLGRSRTTLGLASRRNGSALKRNRAAREQEQKEQAVLSEAKSEERKQQEQNSGNRNAPVLTDKSQNTKLSPELEKTRSGEIKQLKAPPKRTLQPVSRIAQTQGNGLGIRRVLTGKENVPPGIPPMGGKLADDAHKPPIKMPRRSDDSVATARSAGTTAPYEVELKRKSTKVPLKPADTVRKRGSDTLAAEDEASFDSHNSSFSNASTNSLRLTKRQKTSIDSLPSPPGLTADEEMEFAAPNDFLIPGIQPREYPIRKLPSTRPLDPVLTEDLARCEMYEESWLSAQEASVSQLANHLLTQFSPIPTAKDRVTLRRELLPIYASQPFALVFSRVHASLLYGALSITQSFLDKSSTAKLGRHLNQHCGWGTDVGLRQNFLSVFMDSYEQNALVSALEVVVGRDMFALANDREAARKVLENFMDRYIVRSEDLLAISAEPMRGDKKLSKQKAEDEDRGSPAWLLRRSILRSLMLVLLLDKSKVEGVIGRQCLFKKTSQHKSSSSILTALARLLLPTMGDISKPLSHLNYTLQATQQPLAELDYKIKNLAVDMRDGVRLSRMVEVLVYSQGDHKSGLEDWELTPHIQYPATARPQKLANVSLVLSSIAQVGGIPTGVEARDIVDGYREKTVGLLWTLLSSFGLGMLIDRGEVAKEILRLDRKYSSKATALKSFDERKTDYPMLLLEWAQSVGQKSGLVVDNFTTSFADGAAFQAIVEEYEQWFPSLSKSDHAASLETKLKGIGCNSYFAGLFGSDRQKGRILNREFTIAALAYLCSRLLQPCTQERAAITIQRAYRQHHCRWVIHQRISLLRMAYDCAECVNTKMKITNACIIIQRAYRQRIQRSLANLFASATYMQSICRGAQVRRDVKRKLNSVIAVQRKWRGIRETRFLQRMGVAKKAFFGLQAMIRGRALRAKISAQKTAVKLIERRWAWILEGRKARAQYLEQRNAALLIQRFWARVTATKEDRKAYCAVIQGIKQVQAQIRAVQARQTFKAMITATMKIQQWTRSTLDTRRIRASYQQTRVAALTLQKAWRQHAWVFRMRRISREITLVQSLWRGYVLRKSSSPKLRIIRKRLAKIELKGKSVEDTLGAKTKRGLDLVKSKSGFGRGVTLLEMASKYSVECSNLIVEDAVALQSILSFIDTTLPQITKSASSMAARNLLTAAKLFENISVVPNVLVSFAVSPKDKSMKDVFMVLFNIVDTLKASPVKTPQADLLLGTLRTMKRCIQDEGIRRKLIGRRKWIEKVLGTAREIKEGKGRKRGTEDDGRVGLVVVIAALLQS